MYSPQAHTCPDSFVRAVLLCSSHGIGVYSDQSMPLSHTGGAIRQSWVTWMAWWLVAWMPWGRMSVGGHPELCFQHKLALQKYTHVSTSKLYLICKYIHILIIS